MRLSSLILFCVICGRTVAQTPSSDSLAELQLAEAKKYLLGIGISKNEPKAFQMYSQLAQLNNRKAMNMLGKLYYGGLGVAKNKEQAIYWFTQAGQRGVVESWYNIGLIFKDDSQAQDFEKAYEYFDKAAQLGDHQSIYAVAYMHYKGLGCAQDYSKAFDFFKKGAYLRRSNSMYFYGLCWRNGYGVSANVDSANYWLERAAKKGYRMAAKELASEESENSNGAARALSTRLRDEYLFRNTALNSFQKVTLPVNSETIEGKYEGFIIRYDWSGQHAISSAKLQLEIVRKNGLIIGQWIENDSVKIPFNAEITSSSMVFNNTKYTKTDHYSPKKGIEYIFQDAKLQWTEKNDTIFLVGNIRMFSPERKEPDKPIFISLKKYRDKRQTNSIITEPKTNEKSQQLVFQGEMNAYPNPFTNIITIEFDLKERAEVQVQLFTLDGKPVYHKKSALLDPGFYTFPIYSKDLVPGNYMLKVSYGRTFNTSKVVKM
jgi:uncharacterized protein